MALPIQATPTYTTVLPISGQTVEYRPFLVKEQNILVQAKEGEDAKRTMQSVKKLLQAVTNDKIVVELANKEFDSGGHILRYDTRQLENGGYTFGLVTKKQKTIKKFGVKN